MKEVDVKLFNQFIGRLYQYWNDHDGGAQAWNNVKVTTLTASGTTTNDNAAAGNVGEYLSSFSTGGTNFPGANNAYANSAMSLSLTAGDWDVSGNVTAVLNGATMSGWEMTITTSSGSGGTLGIDNIRSGPPAASYNMSVSLSNIRISIASSSTLYLVLLASYSAGNPQYYGGLHARRVR